MKHIIILADGMADHAVAHLSGLTPLQYADTPYMDMLAKKGKTGRLQTIPKGFYPGSEVANTAILGYDLNQVYEGRGPLEAASIGYELKADDLALRCNFITIRDGKIENHHGGHLETKESEVLIDYLNQKLGNEQIRFVTGTQYRNLLIIKGGNKHIFCVGPHDHPNEPWQPLLTRPESNFQEASTTRMSPQQTADLLNHLVKESQKLLSNHPFNKDRSIPANSIWPWGGGYRPAMKPLRTIFPQIKRGSVISAVDLIKGIGHYAGLDVVNVPRVTGTAYTNYEGKTQAALNELYNKDFVFLHLEATDEAGHDGDLQLKLQAIDALEHRVVEPIYREIRQWEEPVCMAILPDHPTPVEIRTHVDEPVPFLIWHKGILPDDVQVYDETSCSLGSYGLLHLSEFMNAFMKE